MANARERDLTMEDKLAVLSKLTAAQLLAVSKPEHLFTREESSLKREYRHLVFIWHPDRCRDDFAREVLPHINELYQAAKEKLAQGNWETPGFISLCDRAGQEYRLRFLKRRPFELGEMLIGDSMVAYLVDARHKAFFDNAVCTVGNFTYASDTMEREVSRYLPTIRKIFEAKDGRFVMVLHKNPGLLLLRDILDYYSDVGYPSEWPRHVAWIQSTLHNLCCYLEFAGLTHNDISPDTYFISPLEHSGALLGGWWYAERHGQRLLGVPSRTYNLMPLDVKEGKLADMRVDLELVRSVGRELLRDASGMKFLHTWPAPEPLLAWLRHPTTGSALMDYRLWRERVLMESFGKPRFVEMHLKSADIYA